jgi:flagella basal body P-ring formation protein FlgA
MAALIFLPDLIRRVATQTSLKRLLLSLALLVCASHACAQQRADPKQSEVDSAWFTTIEAAIGELPRFSNMTTSVNFPERLPKWPACKGPKASPGSGSSSTGKFPISLRCESPRWLGQIVVTVEASKRHLVATRNLSQGQIVQEADLTESDADWTKLPDEVATQADQLIGRTLVKPIQQGQPFTLNFVRLTAVIRAGDRVRVQMAGSNFTVSGDGVAVQQGAVGDSIRVKMGSGQLVPATVLRAGLVELKLD